jgi:hypothetical protein
MVTMVDKKSSLPNVAISVWGADSSSRLAPEIFGILVPTRRYSRFGELHAHRHLLLHLAWYLQSLGNSYDVILIINILDHRPFKVFS